MDEELRNQKAQVSVSVGCRNLRALQDVLRRSVHFQEGPLTHHGCAPAAAAGVQ